MAVTCSSLAGSSNTLFGRRHYHHRSNSDATLGVGLRRSFLSFSSSSSLGRGIQIAGSDSQSLVAIHNNARAWSIPKITAVRHLQGSVTRAQGLRFAVVVARFNEIVTKQLLEGALSTFKNCSVREEDVDVVWVPGSFEIGVTAKQLGKTGKYHAVLCIGAVALNRAGGKSGNKGAETALTAIEMASLFENHLK